MGTLKAQFADLEKSADKLTGNLTKSFSKSTSGINKALKALTFTAITAGLGKFAKSAIQASSDLQEWNNVVQVTFGEASDSVEAFANQAVKQFGLSNKLTKQLAGTFMAMSNGLGIATDAGAKMSIQLTGLSADMASFFNTTADKTANALTGIFTGQSRALKQYGIVLSEANLEAFRLARGIKTSYSAMSEAQKVVLRYNYVLQQTANAQGDFTRTTLSWANQMKQLNQNWTSLITTIGNGLVQVLTPVVILLNKILSSAVAIVNALAKVFGGTGIKAVSFSAGQASTNTANLANNAVNASDGFADANDNAKALKKTIAGFDELNILSSDSGAGGGSGGGSGGSGGGGAIPDVGPEDIDSYFETYDEEGILNKFEEMAQKIKDLIDKADWEGVGGVIADGLNKAIQIIDEWITGTFEPRVKQWAENLARILNGLISDADWELIGKSIADGMNSLIHIFNEFLETLDSLKLGEGIGKAINSWFDDVDWEGLGKLITNRINFLIKTLRGALEEFIKEARENGGKIGEAIASAINNFDWDSLATDIYLAINSLAEMIIGASGEIDWNGLVEKINGFISDAIAGLDMETIKNAIKTLVENIVNVLIELDWYELGEAIGEAFSSVDWLGVLQKVKDEVIWPAFKGFWDGLMADGKNYLIGWIGKISSWLEKSFLGPIVAKLLTGGFLLAVFTNGISAFLKGAWKGLLGLLGKIFDGATLSTFFGDLFVNIGEFGLGEGILTSIAGVSTKLGAILEVLEGAFWPIAIVVTSLLSSFGGLGGLLERIGKIFKDTAEWVGFFWDKLGGSTVVELLRVSFGHLAKAFGRVYDALGKLKPVWDALFKAISFVAGLVGGVLIVAFDALGSALAIVVELASGLVDIFGSFLEWIGGIVEKAVEGIVNIFKWLKYVLIGDPIIIDMWEGIKQIFSDAIQAVVDFVKGLVDSVVQFFMNLWNKAVEIWEGIKKSISEKVQAVKQTVIEVWNNVKTKTIEVWNNLKTKVLGIWDSIKNGAKEKLDKVTGFFSETWKSIKDAWSGVKKFFSDIWDGISGSAKTAVNAVIRTLNKLSFDVPDWVPKIGGSKFGFNIPYLAHGGIITSPTIAMVGEYSGANSNPEIVTPQSLLQEIIRSENTELVSAIYQMTRQVVNAIDDKDLSVTIGDDTIANSANRGNNNYKRRTGKPLFSM